MKEIYVNKYKKKKLFQRTKKENILKVLSGESILELGKENKTPLGSSTIGRNNT